MLMRGLISIISLPRLIYVAQYTVCLFVLTDCLSCAGCARARLLTQQIQHGRRFIGFYIDSDVCAVVRWRHQDYSCSKCRSTVCIKKLNVSNSTYCSNLTALAAFLRIITSKHSELSN